MKRIILTCMMSICISLLSSAPLMAAANNEDIIAEDRQEQKNTETLEETEEQEIRIQDILPDSGELFEDYMDQELYSSSAQAEKKSARARSRRSTLSETDQKVYDILKEKISQVADGRLASTEFQIPAKDVFGEEILNGYSAEELGVPSTSSRNVAANAFREKINVNLASIIRCLMADCPYEFYWYDKTAGVGYGYPQISTLSSGGKLYYKLAENAAYRMNFCVAGEYAVGSAVRTFRADTSKTGAVTATVAKAEAIVNRYASEDDYNKLCDYRKEICSLTSYNNTAARNGGTRYGNPWQLIWVFDGDPATNVVCEGYAKAFQYLCDLSEFKSNKVECHTVTGTMSGGTGAGAHMWNIVTMDDGRNYLADVTNCDSGSVGADDKLFLAVPFSGSVTDGYTIRAGSSGIRYVYDNDTKELFETDILTLSGQAYVYQKTEKTEEPAANPSVPEAAPGSDTTKTPNPDEKETPSPDEKAAPGSDTTKTPNPDVKETPGPDTVETPSPEVTEKPGSDTTEAPNPDVTKTPVPDTSETPKPDTTKTPSPDAKEETPKSDPKPVNDANKCIYNLLQAQAKTVTKNSIKVTWKKVKGADGYIVYGCPCGNGNKLKKLKTTTATAYTQKNLKKGTYYKYQVKAYKKARNGQAIIGTSKPVYAATSGGKSGNCKSIKLNKNSITLNKGKTCTLKATQSIAADGTKVKEQRKLAFESSNCKVASVTAGGKIKAVGKGKCTIYVYAQNGICTKAAVTVK